MKYLTGFFKKIYKSIFCRNKKVGPPLRSEPISSQKMGGLELRFNNDTASLEAVFLRKKQIVADTPIMLQRTIALLLDGCKMHINILAIIARDEAIATFVIKPFYLTSHILIAYFITKLQNLFFRAILQMQFLAFYLWIPKISITFVEIVRTNNKSRL